MRRWSLSITQQAAAVTEPRALVGLEQGETATSRRQFKNELSKFLLKEWGKLNYWEFFRGMKLFAAYGGECFLFVPDAQQNITVSSLSYFQGDHEEADTLIAFHAANSSEDDVVGGRPTLMS